MKRIDRFILKSFIGPFFAILFIVLFILMMQSLWLYIDELVGKGLSLRVVAEFLMWGSFLILPLALPLATLLSSMMVMGQMSEHNELTALKAAGVSVTRVMTPIIIASVLITIGAFFSSNNLVPYSYNKICTLHDDILKTKEEIKIPAGTFYDGIDGFVLRTDATDEKTGMMHGIMVYDHTKGKGNTGLMLADSALLKMSDNKEFLTFTLYNGMNYQETNSMRYRDTSLELQKINFTKQELLISLENYAFEKTDSTKYSDQIKCMNVVQLKDEKDSLRHIAQTTREQQFDQLMSNGILTKFRQLDTAFVNRVKTDYHSDRLGKWDDISSEAAAYRSASENANQMVSQIMAFSRESYEYMWYLRRADLEFLRKFAEALACFIMFFIGAPIGALVRKGGLGVPAIISVLFFVLYYIIDTIGSKLAKDGAITGAEGAFIATAVLLPIGAFLTWKAVNDASLSGSDTLKNQWRKLKHKVVNLIRKPRIVYMGTPEFAVAPLDRLIQNGFKIVGAVTVADKPSGRGLSVNESAVKKYAVAHGIPVLQPLKLKDPGFLEQLKAWKADLFVVVAFRMLPEEVWAMPKFGTINLHAALLPQYRGAAPINWAVINGESMTGVTTFMIDKNIDTGGIILREEYRIGADETAGQVHDALMEKGAELVVDTVKGLVEGSVETRIQQSFIQGAEVLKPAPKLTRELCHIDWTDTTRHIYNLIRGLSPYPAAYTELTDGVSAPVQLKVYAAEKMEWSGPEAPGSLLTDGKNYLAVRTADGAVSLKSLQLAGKKRMDVGAFLLGFRDAEKYHCTEGTSKAEIAKTRPTANA
jgi:methionyl-tRNA formyltransferase